MSHEGIFEVQPALTTPDGTKRPDYVFYRDAASLNANKGRTLNEELLRGSAPAVGDAKYWDRPLDVSLKGGKGKGDPFTKQEPSEEQNAPLTRKLSPTGATSSRSSL